jgi:amino acid adenylation domain-containing protein
VVLTHGAARDALAAAMAGLPGSPALIDLDEAGLWAAQPDVNPDPAAVGLTSAHLAYVIYTSGSTGTPKGVAMHHRPLVNLLQWQISSEAEEEGRRTFQVSALGFDMSFHDIFGTLSAGKAIILSSDRLLYDPQRLFDHVLACSASRLYLPTAVFHEAFSDASLRRYGDALAALPEGLSLNVAGEQLRLSDRAATLATAHPQWRLRNNYGPSETHVCTFYDVVAGSPWTPIPPIGRPIANTRIYLLDPRLEPVPLGAAGEIYIGGAGVARGYLNRPALTAERFVPDPFGAEPGARLYRTGDLGRYLPDGNIEFLGRNDHQVKIRGFRIELGEIEARLAEHPGVREAVVLAREDSPGDKRLVAYVTGPGEDDVPGLAAALRTHLAQALPEYMVPAAYVRLEALPLTANGKLDRSALPAPDGAAYVSRAYEAPVGAVEEALASIWVELLGVERVGRHDNFFELGGHSLLAVRVISRVRDVFGITPPLHALFQEPALTQVSANISKLLDQQAAHREERAIAVSRRVAELSDAEVADLLAKLESA